MRVITPLIEAFTQPGQLVLDPFARSGSTLVAAAIAGRRYLGIELEREYCEVDSEQAASLGGLFQWLQDRDYPGLARTVQDAMEHYR